MSITESFSKALAHLDAAGRAERPLLPSRLATACTAVLPELQRLVFDFPLREQFRIHLMVALHRSGRSVEALSTYLDWRQTLEATWDLEPGQAIQRLWDDIRLRAPDLEVGGG